MSRVKQKTLVPDSVSATEVLGSQVGLQVPIDSDAKGGNFQFHVNIQLPSNVAHPLHKVAEALDQKRARLNSGTRVTNRSQAATWLFEELNRQAEGLAAWATKGKHK